MPLKYQSGEEIRKGDRVLFHTSPGVVELVADPLVSDPETDWYVQEYGGGVMVLQPGDLGRCFISDTEDAEDLVLVSRAAEASSDAKS
jgi:hypothetical protein